MKEERLLRAFTQVDEAYIQEAAPPAKPKVPWKKWAVLAACLCLAIALPVVSLTGRTGKSCPADIPYWEYGLTASAGGEGVYFCYEDGMYYHAPGLASPVRLGDFRGSFQETEDGILCVNEETGDVYAAEGAALTRLGSLPLEDSTGRFRLISAREGRLCWCQEESQDGQSIVVTYETDCAGSGTRRLFSTPYHGFQTTSMTQHIRGGSIYFMAKGGILQRYDLDSQEVVTVYHHFWSQLAEPYKWYFFPDFVLCQVIQYEEKEDGTHSVVGYPYYLLPYDGSAAWYLTDITSLGGDPVFRDGRIYYTARPDPEKDRTIVLVSCDPATGQITALSGKALAADDLAVCTGGLYYVAENTLCYRDLASGQERQILPP